MNRPNASEKIDSFPGRLLFSSHLCYFSCVLFGGMEKFRIFANGRAGIYEQGKTFTIDIRTP